MRTCWLKFYHNRTHSVLVIFAETYFTFFKAVPSELNLIKAGAYFWHLRLEGFIVSALIAREGSVVSNSCILNEMAKRRKLAHCG